MTAGIPPESPNKQHTISCWNHRYAWRMTCEEYDELRAWAGNRCALCGYAHPMLNIDHDHEIGRHGIRGLLCPHCNAGRMKCIDKGFWPVDEQVREYLMHPWYLDRQGKTLGHDPLVHVSVDQLSSEDRAELQQLGEIRYPDPSWLRKASPRFEHPDIAACLANGDIRPVLRLMLLDLWQLRDLDIAAQRPFVRSWATAQAVHRERDVARCDHSTVRPEFDTNGNPVRLTCAPPCTREWTVRVVDENGVAA